MIVCWDCRNLETFVQVSVRGDARLVGISMHDGPQPAPWDRADNRSPGLYCARCGKVVEVDPDEARLVDDRIDFVTPADFRAGPIVEEIKALRPDAEWYEVELPARAPEYAQVTEPIHPAITEALERTGRRRLFTHQAAAITAAMRGDNTIQATSAGSGKSLGFVVPVLDALCRDPHATALFLFPLRALANDQMDSLARLGIDDDPWTGTSLVDVRLDADLDPMVVGRRDSGTPEHERTQIRRSARLVISNPDALHAGILRYGTHHYKDGSSWARFFRGLRYVVLDEVHAYQGVFGSNVGNVLRRARRMAAYFGAEPQFLAASATIGNPLELVRRLTGLQDFTLIDADGSERRRRTVLVCNPPPRSDEHDEDEDVTGELDDGELLEIGDELTHGALVETVESTDRGRVAPQTVAIELAAAGALASPLHPPVRLISFCRSRNEVFGLTKRLQSRLKDAKRSDLGAAVAPYAATFLARDRLEAEGRLRDGSTLAIISTNALELGIDIPDLSIALLVGYPGQISSFRQRAGRVGRAGEGVVVLIVGDDPLQQFVASDPETLPRLLDGRPEEVIVNPEAPEIAMRYGLAPAQAELGGLCFEDVEYFGSIVETVLADVTGPPSNEHRGRPYWQVPISDEPYQDLRSVGGGRSCTVIVQKGRDFTPVGVIGADVAPRDCFVPAIWFGPDGDLFRVTGFDDKAGEVYCEGPVDVPYLTRGITFDHVSIATEQVAPIDFSGAAVGFGALDIVRQVQSYKELPFSGPERSKPVERAWPPHEFRTTGLYVNLPAEWFTSTDSRDATIRAVEHLLLSLAPTVVACDPFDLEATSSSTTIYLYDSFGGDLGLSRPAFDRFGEVARYALDTVERCACARGCPSCVMLSRRPDGNRDLSKDGARTVLRRLVDAAAG